MAARRSRENQTGSQLLRRGIVLGIIVLLGYLVVTQVKGLRPSLTSIEHARPSYVAWGLGGLVATFLVAALMYQLLALHALRYRRTLLVQVASGFTNRLLPVGLGGMGLIAQYLRSQRHAMSEAITVVGMDNVIGIIGHFSLFFLVLAIANVSSHAVHLPHVSWIVWLAIILVIAIVTSMKQVRSRLARLFGQIGHDLRSYRTRPWRLVLAFGNSILLTNLYVGILWASAHAVGSNLSFPKVLVVFTAGSIIGTATPTPGGLVGTEAGLFGGFLAYGVSSGPALATALLYRLLTYWLPILPGIIGFWIADRIKLLQNATKT